MCAAAVSYLDNLNERQLEAVRATEGPVRVIAGAGTGKTRALTARFCYLTDLLGIDPEAILCVTFTNKAAAEMKQRVRRMLGDFDSGFICTFHSLCVRILKEDIHVLNYPSNFMVMDEEDQKEMLLKIYADMSLTLKELPVKRAIDYIGTRKAESDAYLQHIARLTNRDLLGQLARGTDRMEKIFLHYLYEQKKNFALDFDDLIIFVHHILTSSPALLSKWQQRMEYVMVDEFQDVSPRQYAIARLLAGLHCNLFIVGDPDQTIYTWRGADVSLFLNFDKEYPSAQTIVLDTNYRSTPQIVEASDAMIAHNSDRYPKTLRAMRADGARPVFYHARSEKDEAGWIARRIAALAKDGRPLRDIAILYRAHHLSRPIEDALMKASIPYKIYSGTAFYARREVKDVLAYLRMLVTGDDMSFLRTVNNPPRRIGRKKLELIRNDAEAHGDRMVDALRRLAGSPQMKGTSAAAYLSVIDAAAPLAGKLALGDLLQTVLDLSQYEEMLRTLGEWERLDNLAELKRAIEEAGHDDDTSLEDFLARAALVANIDRDRDETDALRMMTVHTAKGMEFPVVFVPAMNEGSMPSRRSAGPDDIEEERRLAYVALTRAESALFLSDSEGVNHDNTGKTPSRFVYEIGTERMDFERELPPQRVVAAPMAGAGARPQFTGGDLVDHPVFGRGMVMDVDTDRGAYIVQFDRFDTRRSLRFGAPLDPVKPENWK